MSAPVKKVPIHLQSSQNRLLLKNGKIVNDHSIVDEDVYIEDGIIKQIGKNLIIPGGTRIIDARGKYVMPGGIDPHTHFEFEFMGSKSVDDFYHGTKAAIAGGTTMILDFVFPKRGESPLDAYYEHRRRADGKVCCDYSLHVCITSWSEHVRKEMEMLCKNHGVNSFKMFMAYDFMLDDGELYSAFEQCEKLGALAMVHAENGKIITKNAERLIAKGVTGPEGHELSRPEEVEAEAVNRACVIAKQVNAPLYIGNISSEKSNEVLSEHRTKGLRVYGEVAISAIGNVSCAGNINSITSPPIRSGSDPSWLVALLASDDLQVTGSDNCTFNRSQKELGKDDFRKIPNGVNGVEDRMSIVWEKGVNTGTMDPMRFVAVTSTNAAKIFNLYPRKGCIAVGSDADIVIWNPGTSRTISAQTHHQAVDFNIFEGMQCHGVPDFVIVNGRVCFDDGQLKVVEGYGRFIETPTYAPYIYDPEKLNKLNPDGNWLTEMDSIQLQKLSIEERNREIESYCSPPAFLEAAGQSISHPCCKEARHEGQRDMQESTFSISEELDVKHKSGIRVRNPPGGKSSGFW